MPEKTAQEFRTTGRETQLPERRQLRLRPNRYMPLIPNISEGNYNGDIHVTIKSILYCIINYIGGTQNE